MCIRDRDKNGKSSTYTDFFGDDFNTNGIVDMIPEEFGRKEFLEDINKLTLSLIHISYPLTLLALGAVGLIPLEFTVRLYIRGLFA